MANKEKEIEFNIFISEFLGQELSAFDLAKEAFIYFDNQACKQPLKKDIEIAKLEGMLEAMKKEVFRLHPDDCNCMTCEEAKDAIIRNKRIQSEM